MELFKKLGKLTKKTIPTPEEIFEAAVKKAAKKAANPLLFWELVSISRELLSMGPPEIPDPAKGIGESSEKLPVDLNPYDLFGSLTLKMRCDEKLRESCRNFLQVGVSYPPAPDSDDIFCVEFEKREVWKKELEARENGAKQYLEELLYICDSIKRQINDKNRDKRWVAITRQWFASFVAMLNTSLLFEYIVFNDALEFAQTELGEKLYRFVNSLESLKKAQKELHEVKSKYGNELQDGYNEHILERIWDEESRFRARRQDYESSKKLLNRLVDRYTTDMEEEYERNRMRLMEC